MRQRDQVEGAAIAAQREGTPDDFSELFEGKKLGDRQFTDRDDEIRLEQVDLIIQPRRTIPDLVRRGNAIAPGGCFAGKAAANRGKINLRANLFLAHFAELLEPTEEGATGSPGEGFAEHGFFHAGRLADKHHFAQDRCAGNRRRQHPGTAPALEQERDMPIESLLFMRGPSHRFKEISFKEVVPLVAQSRYAQNFDG